MWGHSKRRECAEWEEFEDFLTKLDRRRTYGIELRLHNSVAQFTSAKRGESIAIAVDALDPRIDRAGRSSRSIPAKVESVDRSLQC